MAGFIITQNPTGEIIHYEIVGYVALAANALAIWFVAKIVMHQTRPPVVDVALK
jgi:hypothetical protein